jgi:molybdopterin synthase sulfur carrier subunit
MVKVYLPSILNSVTGENRISLSVKTVRELIEKLICLYGEPMREKLFDQDGELIRFWQIFVNGLNIRFLDYLDTMVDENDEIAILPSVNGG